MTVRKLAAFLLLSCLLAGCTQQADPAEAPPAGPAQSEPAPTPGTETTPEPSAPEPDPPQQAASEPPADEAFVRIRDYIPTIRIDAMRPRTTSPARSFMTFPTLGCAMARCANLPMRRSDCWSRGTACASGMRSARPRRRTGCGRFIRTATMSQTPQTAIPAIHAGTRWTSRSSPRQAKRSSCPRDLMTFPPARIAITATCPMRLPEMPACSSRSCRTAAFPAMTRSGGITATRLPIRPSWHLSHLPEPKTAAAATFFPSRPPFLLRHGQPNRIQDQIHRLPYTGLVSYNADVVEVMDHGQVQHRNEAGLWSPN